ncbi:hypothetical protein ACFSDD_01550 [Salipiger marinus]|jgi:hypothetical protein|uniref:Uncharacterized protein n=1 Tax=Salipiger marinus TaxID=555512 RepID=A0A1G8S7V5_9RHOB|nr:MULTISPECIES: hypothetical protein [Salipiger]HBM59643.1 hypothetical protein [Citreicella sp.]MCD1620164.1 hypothetical protein [Salipiger manganoxidans]MEB3421169.1 hypothetical protein [Salipiger manganoxidans]SDJ25302.1 hypothetical protein SAMN04487993_102342 [Salipiger marinus]HBT02316.1 hypothetical protein [Citreicella sp.]|tara:strand:+ start:471 stop:761 length:291 start_codon:yes stop_codon:yes gene_type:complete
MKPMACALFLLTVLPASAAQAACFVEYKAKQDNPLRLHYGISTLPGAACPPANAAAAQMEIRLDRNGWTLLNVVHLSAEEPSAEKKANAGDFYLRY